MYTIIRRGNQRNARQVLIDRNIIAQYHSAGDVFQSDRQIKSHEYSAQVPNITYDARRAAIHEFAEVRPPSIRDFLKVDPVYANLDLLGYHPWHRSPRNDDLD